MVVHSVNPTIVLKSTKNYFILLQLYVKIKISEATLKHCHPLYCYITPYAMRNIVKLYTFTKLFRLK